MTKSFAGRIEVDIRDSEPDWTPFEAPRAPEGAPNVVYLVLDDVGFSAMGCYGGPIETPNIDRIAAEGVRYTQWHTTALCSPTRSCLLTGRNHTRNSMACITELASGFPNASGSIPPENGMLSEILGERGWNTYIVGKWHLCPESEMNLASTRRNWPTGRGFERFYGFLGAETNQWYPELVYDNHSVEQPKTPEEGYHFTDDITTKAIEFIKDAKVLAPKKPFFLYYAPGAAHSPHHAPKHWIERYAGRFDMGYEAIREQTLARQKAMGIVAADVELPPINPIGTPQTLNRLHYVYNFVGSFEQKIVGSEDVPTGQDLLLSASFEKDGEDPPGISTGILSLYHGETKVGEGRIKTQPGKFMIGEEGLCVGRDSGEPVTDDYPAAPPHPFTGGSIKRVGVDVSGEPYVDLEREAAATLMRV